MLLGVYLQLIKINNTAMTYCLILNLIWRPTLSCLFLQLNASHLFLIVFSPHGFMEQTHYTQWLYTAHYTGLLQVWTFNKIFVLCHCTNVLAVLKLLEQTSMWLIALSMSKNMNFSVVLVLVKHNARSRQQKV